jgi:mannosyltransferase OCH1-like enzyme
VIPKIIHHIWVGPRPAPRQWMETWPQTHPGWRYMIWDNETVFRLRWRNQRLVNAYRDQEEWRGVADVIRYEILHERGGFMPGADSECLKPVDELLEDDGITAWAVYENEQAAPGLITPVYAAQRGALFLETMIRKVSEASAGEPWKCVGNLLMQSVYESRPWFDVKVWPSWMFNPEHYSGLKYTGPEKPYARQHWASTKGGY